MHYFSNLFWNKTLRVLDSSSVHRHKFSTVHAAMLQGGAEQTDTFQI